MTLDSFFSTHVPGSGRQQSVLLKLDVEGAECRILRSGLSSLASLKQFCALVEIAHLNPEDLAFLQDRFLMAALDLRHGSVNRVGGLEPVRAEASLFWQQDILLFRKPRQEVVTAEL